jgi:prepilin-type N-terminal cleavage/methylation domain-containing protein/prepilin-type processing-associated H-X9-DG protein
MKTQYFTSRFSKSKDAFTLIELLVTISIIAVLAGLIMPAVFKALAKSKQTACLNHLRQLAIGFSLYHGDFNEAFPGCASKRTYGPQPEDWIWWQRDRDPKQSAIARYVSDFNPTLFRCPSDKDALKVLQSTNRNPYAYSYSLTSYDVEKNAKGEQVSLGLASIFTKDKPRKEYLFKFTSINNPAQKIMLVEEDRINLQDGRWLPNHPSFDPLAIRHQGKANVAFADSHIQLVSRAFGTNAVNSVPSL